MASSLRSRLEESTSSLLARAGKFSNRVGNKLLRMSVNASPWRHATDSRTGRPVNGSVERAERLGYVEHGEFGLKLAYDPDVLTEDMVDTIERWRYERFEGRRSRDFVVDGDRVIELGAGLGFLSALIMSTTKVDDFQLVEADPRLADVIRRTHRAQRSRRSVDDPNLRGDVRPGADRPRRGGVPRRRQVLRIEPARRPEPQGDGHGARDLAARPDPRAPSPTC